MQILCDRDEEVSKLSYVYPYIAMVGDSCVQFFLVAEVIVSETDGFLDARFDLICAYFTYNIVYPKPLYPVLLFIQRFVMDMKDSQTVPPSLMRALSALQK